MFCPVCESEFREGFSHCSACDADLVASLEPETPPPGDVQLVPLTDDCTPDELAGLADHLEQAGVPYVVEAGTALTLLDRIVEGAFEPERWRARVYIASAFEARAQRILARIKAESER